VKIKLQIKNKKLTSILTILGTAMCAGIVIGIGGWFGGGASIPADTMTRGLVGYWSMDEGMGDTAYDGSANSNNGTLTNGPTWTDGKKGGALSFDGVDDYVDCGNDESLRPDTYTIEGWVKTTDSNGSLVSFGLNQPMLGVWGSDLIAYLGSDYYRKFNTDNVTDNNWHHIVFVIENNDVTTAKAYVDGEELSVSATGSTGSANAKDRCYIGYSQGQTWDLTGLIDEVRIYNRALSAEEIRFHYNRGGPVAQWDFNEGSGDTAYDTTDNNNDGTLNYSPAGSNTSYADMWTSGKYGSAIEFDGTDDYVDNSKANFRSGDSEGTIEAWIKTSSSTAQTLVMSGDEGTSNDFLGFMITNSPAGALRVTQKRADTQDDLRGTTTINDNEWHFVVLRSDGSTWTIFIDGVEEDLNVSGGANTGD